MDRKQVGLIRTGCITCLASGVRCKSGNPGCERSQSTQWTSNQSWTTPEVNRSQILKRYAESLSTPSLNASGWQGTNREIQSLHFFGVVSAPELAGYIDSAFWQSHVLEATRQDNAIKHAVAALGANHEYRLRHQASRYNKETEGLWLFALRQCNKAIRSLTVQACGAGAGASLRMLTASLLFVYFESLAGREEFAFSHIRHARRLTTHGKRLLNNNKQGKYDTVLAQQLRTIEPIVAHFESQLSQWDMGRDEKAALGRLDINCLIVIEHIADARMLLCQGISYMTEIVFALDGVYSEDDIREMSRKKHALWIWLQQWEMTFQNFLAGNRDQMDVSDSIQSKLLMAHYYGAFIICATDFSRGEDNWAAFTPQFKNILSFATEIVEAQPYHTMSWQAPQTPHFSSTMNLSQPLYICASRCTDPETGAKALKLLAKLPPCEGARSHFRTELMERHLRVVTGNKLPFRQANGQEQLRAASP